MLKNIRIKYAILILLLISVLISKYFLHTSAYPSLNIQRLILDNKKKVNPVRILDSAQIVNDLQFLSSDRCQGRQPGTEGHSRTVSRILLRLRESGADSFNSSMIQKFSGKIRNGTTEGNNIIGWIKGTEHPEKYVVISAHYDHLGKSTTGEIYHGASDNASGTACLLAMVKFFKLHPHPYSLIFAFFDREETGEEGSSYFVNDAASDVHHLDIKFNLNIDMIARNDKNEIFACGISHYPSFIYLIKETQKKTNSKLLIGHDTGRDRNDWTSLSDHYRFHMHNIPFLYLGVEDHPDYHKTTDTFEKIDLGSYIENCNLTAMLAKLIKF